MSKLKPALTYMNNKCRKRIINSKVKSIALYGSQLILGQPQSIMSRACAIIMRTNHEMFKNIEGLRSTSAICNYLKIYDPRQDITKTSFKQIHKIIENRKPEHIVSQLKIPKRKSGKVYLRGGVKSIRSSHSPIHASIELFNAIPPAFRALKHKKNKKPTQKS